MQSDEGITGGSPATKRVSLVLGSGGARGLAHIGVIQELERRGYAIEAIAGCSIGALVGGIYAVGKLEEYVDWVTGLERRDVVALLDVTGSRGGLFAGRKIMQQLHAWIGGVAIEDLPFKYTAVAVDIEREKEVWMNEGSLYDAIRASIAIPGILTPHRYRNRLLVDGGVLTPIPVAPTVNALTDMTVVVDANGPPTAPLPFDEGEQDSDPEADQPGVFSKSLAKLGMERSKSPTAREEMSIIDILLRSLDTVQAAMTRQHLAVFHPDLVIRVPRNFCMIHEFHRASEVIEFGRSTAAALLENPELERRQWL